MSPKIQTAAIHHMTLTVTDIRRSVDFYTTYLGFQKAMDLSETRVVMANGNALVALSEAPDPSRAIQGDKFDENRVGLDHVSFSVSSLAELEAAAGVFDQDGIEHGEIKDLGADLAIYVMAFRDPDNTQLELTAPYS